MRRNFHLKGPTAIPCAGQLPLSHGPAAAAWPENSSVMKRHNGQALLRLARTRSPTRTERSHESHRSESAMRRNFQLKGPPGPPQSRSFRSVTGPRRPKNRAMDGIDQGQTEQLQRENEIEALREALRRRDEELRLRDEESRRRDQEIDDLRRRLEEANSRNVSGTVAFRL